MIITAIKGGEMIKLIKDIKKLSRKEQVGWLIAAGLYVCFVIIPLINIFVKGAK